MKIIERTRLDNIRGLFPFIILLVVTDLAIILNIPVLRQILGFTFFTVVPGLLILHLLRMEKVGAVEKLVFSVGLSIVFLMLSGLIVNSARPVLGYETPLSTNSLLVSFNVILLGLSILAHLTRRSIPLISLSDLKMSDKEKAVLLLPALFPLLSILGMRVMNATDNNVIIMVLLLLIPAYVIFISFYHRQVPDRTYPVVIYFIGISVLMLLALRSNHIIGSDSHTEYYSFITTSNSLWWDIKGKGLTSVCLSISLLPTVYQSLLRISPEFLFKFLYPLLLSISPLVTYSLARKYVSSFYAFLASFVFIAHPTLIWTTSNSRGNLGVLFFILAVLVLFHNDRNRLVNKVLFITFAATTVVSHYSTTYIAFFVWLLTCLGMWLLSIIISRKKKLTTSSETAIVEGNPADIEGMPTTVKFSRYEGSITITAVLLFFAMLFAWYSQLTQVSFGSGVEFISQTLTNLNKFFVVEARSQYVQAALGSSPLTKGIPQQIKFVAGWLVIAFISFGILITMGRFRRMVYTAPVSPEMPDFLRQKLDAEYFILSLSGCILLVLGVVLPKVSVGYSFDREEFQVLAFLALFFVIGTITVSRYLRVLGYWLAVPLLVVYFLGTTGMTYQLWGIPETIMLNSVGSQYNTLFIHDRESQAALWLGQHTVDQLIFSDRLQRRLVSQGIIAEFRVFGYTPDYLDGTELGGYLYLRYQNVVAGQLVLGDKLYNIDDYPDFLISKNKLYANSGSEIYREPPKQ